MAVTFTRTAARDLQAELRSLGVTGCDEVWAGTLHSFCFSVLSRQAVFELTGRVARPLLKFEERFLAEDLVHGPGDFGGVRDCRARLEAFNAAWARLQTDQPGWASDPVDRAFERELDEWLRFHEAILVGELVPITLNYLRANPSCRERGMFDHVLVDEFQDLNRAEQELVELLAGEAHYTVVGDEDQSIYSFKHAHPEGIANFHHTHPGTIDVGLVDCRRCPQWVVRLANHLICHNSTREERELAPWPANPEGAVQVLQWQNGRAEAEGLRAIIRDYIGRDEITAGDVLVLSPRRHFGYAIRDALIAADIPALSFFHEEELEGDPKNITVCQGQRAFTLLNLLVSPEDRVALRCWCGFGSSTLNAGGWRRLRLYCEQEGQSPREALQALADGRITLPYTRPITDRFRVLLEREAELQGLEGSALLDRLFPGGEEWAAGCRGLADQLGADGFDASELQEALRVGITQPELPTEAAYVRVMSLHKSKGLSAKVVVVAGCIEGVLPREDFDAPLAGRRRQVEEQRRLFYVAITRCREVLVLSSVLSLQRRLVHRIGARVVGGDRWWARTVASRFLEELGPERPAATRGEEVVLE